MSLFREVYQSLAGFALDASTKRAIALAVTNTLRPREEHRESIDDFGRAISAAVAPKLLTQTCQACHYTLRAYSPEHLADQMANHNCARLEVGPNILCHPWAKQESP